MRSYPTEPNRSRGYIHELTASLHASLNCFQRPPSHLDTSSTHSWGVKRTYMSMYEATTKSIKVGSSPVRNFLDLEYLVSKVLKSVRAAWKLISKSGLVRTLTFLHDCKCFATFFRALRTDILQLPLEQLLPRWTKIAAGKLNRNLLGKDYKTRTLGPGLGQAPPSTSYTV